LTLLKKYYRRERILRGLGREIVVAGLLTLFEVYLAKRFSNTAS